MIWEAISFFQFIKLLLTGKLKPAIREHFLELWHPIVTHFISSNTPLLKVSRGTYLFLRWGELKWKITQEFSGTLAKKKVYQRCLDIRTRDQYYIQGRLLWPNWEVGGIFLCCLPLHYTIPFPCGHLLHNIRVLLPPCASRRTAFSPPSPTAFNVLYNLGQHLSSAKTCRFLL